MKIGSLVCVKFPIDIADKHGKVVNQIIPDAVGVVIDYNEDRRQWHVHFNSNSRWWLTENELKMLDNSDKIR